MLHELARPILALTSGAIFRVFACLSAWLPTIASPGGIQRRRSVHHDGWIDSRERPARRCFDPESLLNGTRIRTRIRQENWAMTSSRS